MKIIIKFELKKEYLYYFSLFFVIGFAILMIITYNNAKSIINLTYPDVLKSELNNYKIKLNNYNDSKCKKFIGEYIEEVESDILDSEYELGSAYSLATSVNIMKFYNEGNENCNISDEDKVRLVTNYLSILVLMNELFLPYTNQYEIKISDLKNNVDQLNLTSMTYNSLKNNEIDVLRKYMDILEKGNYYE